MYLRCIGLTVLITITGCATTSTPKSMALSLSENGAAIIHGQGGGVGGFLKELLIPIGTKKDIDLVSVDGGSVEKASSADVREYWILPGERTLEVSCRVMFDSTFTAYGRREIALVLQAGKEYLLDAVVKTKKSNWGFKEDYCVPEVVEKSST